MRNKNIKYKKNKVFCINWSHVYIKTIIENQMIKKFFYKIDKT